MPENGMKDAEKSVSCPRATCHGETFRRSRKHGRVCEAHSPEELPAYITERQGVYEDVLQNQWNEIPLGSDFPLQAGGRRLCVISRGVFNHGAGPDFKNAKLAIDGVIRHGDVEIHCKTSDWARHNHFGNPEYRRVILHVVGLDDHSPAAGPKLPMVPLYVLPEKYAVSTGSPSPDQAGLCAHFFNRLDDRESLRFVLDAGLDRLRGKSMQLQAPSARGTDIVAPHATHGATELTPAGTGLAHAGGCPKGTPIVPHTQWSGTTTGCCAPPLKIRYLVRLFELVGVPNNREQFQALAIRYLTYCPDVRAKHAAVILWGESGSLPDPSKCPVPQEAMEIVEKLWNEWWGVRLKYLEPLTFNRQCRPMNSIERRIAILAELLNRFGEYPIPEFAEIIDSMDTSSALREIMKGCNAQCHNDQPSENTEFWTRHTSFFSAELQRPATLLGKSRMLELFVDAILPSIHAMATVEHRQTLVKKVEEVYLALPKMPSNSAIQRTAELCFPGRSDIFKTAAAQQGLLHIGKTWCDRLSLDCKICPIYHLV